MGRERQIQKNEETRNAILKTAVSIGLKEGFEELSIRKITDKLGYSSGIVYHYFKDKQEIIDTIHNRTSMELKSSVDACIDKDRSFEENLKVVFKMLSEISVYQPELCRLILLNRYSHDMSSVDVWLEMITHCVELGIQSGELREIDAEIVSHILLNSFLVTQMVLKNRNGTDEEMVEKIFNSELDIMLNGIINKGDK